VSHPHVFSALTQMRRGIHFRIEPWLALPLFCCLLFPTSWTAFFLLWIRFSQRVSKKPKMRIAFPVDRFPSWSSGAMRLFGGGRPRVFLIFGPSCCLSPLPLPSLLPVLVASAHKEICPAFRELIPVASALTGRAAREAPVLLSSVLPSLARFHPFSRIFLSRPIQRLAVEVRKILLSRRFISSSLFF